MTERLYTAEEVEALLLAQAKEVNLVLKSLLRNLTEVRHQQSRGTGQGAAHCNGVVDGLNIAIAAVKRRIR